MVVPVAGLKKKIHNELLRFMIHCWKKRYCFKNDVDLVRKRHRVVSFLGIVEAVSWLDY